MEGLQTSGRVTGTREKLDYDSVWMYRCFSLPYDIDGDDGVFHHTGGYYFMEEDDTQKDIYRTVKGIGVNSVGEPVVFASFSGLYDERNLCD